MLLLMQVFSIHGGTSMDLIKKNLKLKIIVVFLAFLCWSYVMAKVNPTITREYRNIPVNLRNIENLYKKNLMVIDPKEPRVNVTLRGRRNTLNKITWRDIVLDVNMEEYSETKIMLPIIINIPSETELADISSKNLTFNVDKKIGKTFQIKVETTGELPEKKLTISEMTPEPLNIYVEGPSIKVHSIDKAVVKIDISDVKSDTVKSATLMLLDREGKEVTDVNVENKKVEVLIGVKEIKEIPINVVTKNSAPSNVKILKIYSSPQKIVVTGDSQVINGIEKIDTEPVNLGSVTGNSVIKAKLIIPEDLKLLNPNAEVNVHIETDSESSKRIEIPITELKAKNLAENLKFNIKSENIEKVIMEIKGFDSIVKNYKPEDADFHIDLMNFGEGIYELPIRYTLVDGIKFSGISPEKVIIEITK